MRYEWFLIVLCIVWTIWEYANENDIKTCHVLFYFKPNYSMLIQGYCNKIKDCL